MHEEKELILKDETYAVVGAAIEVHRELGPGFLEAVYHAALKLELANRKIPFETEKTLAIHYKGQNLGLNYRADVICYGQIIVELKAVRAIASLGPARSHRESHSSFARSARATWRPPPVALHRRRLARAAPRRGRTAACRASFRAR